jgi:hypothetical protein
MPLRGRGQNLTQFGLTQIYMFGLGLTLEPESLEVQVHHFIGLEGWNDVISVSTLTTPSSTT